jgi:dinuclear metal center YbgI/SA1388 family protein
VRAIFRGTDAEFARRGAGRGRKVVPPRRGAQNAAMARALPPSLPEVLDILHEIAPLDLAAGWDNVGLLLEPVRGRGAVARVMLTIDMTEPVVAEAVRARTDLLVAYHPPIFQPLKRLCADVPQQRALLAAAAAGLAVYSPHTALDAAPGGIADWLAEGLAAGDEPAVLRPCGEGAFGRFVELRRRLAFAELLRRCKRLLGVRHVRVALPPRRGAVRTFAVAAGSGGAVLRGERADAWITGELSHHDVLAAVAQGTCVVLAEHSNTERGYLGVLRKRLRAAFGRELAVTIAAADRDPLAVA